MADQKFENRRFEDLESSLKSPFIVKEVIGNRSRSSRDREYSKDVIVKRVLSQVKEMKEKGLSWETPEDWDKGFYELGGTSSRRTSQAILSRMRWSEFLEIINGI